MTPALAIENLELKLAGHSVITGVSLLVAAGELAAVVGPNGSGKSTLLRAVYRTLRPHSGVVLVDGDEVWAGSARQAARRLAAVPQERPASIELRVREVVALGRLPYQRPFTVGDARDRQIVDEALEQVGVTDLTDRMFAELSGGERQRVLIARALAQRTKLLILDEPTNHLDVRHQLELLELLSSLHVTTLVAMHDLNLAAAYAHRLHVLDAGRLVASGPPAEVLTEHVVTATFGVRAVITPHPLTGHPQLSIAPLTSG